MRVWAYLYQGGVVASVRRPDDEPPYIGMPVTMVGRGGRVAPAENFVVSDFDSEQRRLTLAVAP